MNAMIQYFGEVVAFNVGVGFLECIPIRTKHFQLTDDFTIP